MPGHSYDDERPAQGFDPARHRREIELMEQRFRERAGRSGGGPISTGEIDARVQDEMQQFFTESHDQLEKVVPNLAEQENHAMKETTGEIRRKIDDFFAQVTPEDAGPARSAPPPSPYAAPGIDPRAGHRTGGSTGGPPPRPPSHTGPISRPVGPPPSEPIGHLPSRRVGPPPRPRDPYAGSHGGSSARPITGPTGGGPPPRRSGGPPPRPAGFQPSDDAPAFGSGGTMRSRVGGQAERPRLDLKTALAKLRGEDPPETPSAAPRRPEPLRRREPEAPPVQAAPSPPPVQAAPPPEPRPAPPPAPSPPPQPPRAAFLPPEPARDPFAESLAPEPPAAGRFIQPPTTTRAPESRPAFASPKIQPPSEDLPPELDRFAFRPDAPVRRPSERPRTESLPPMPEMPGRRRRVELPVGETQVEPIKARLRKSSDLPPPPRIPAERREPRGPASAPESRLPPPPARPAPPSPPAPDPRAAAGPDPAGSFDEIFSEVQSLVLDSLKGSVTETFGVAQELTSEMSEEISQRISQRISEVAVRAAEAARAQARDELEARRAPPPAPEPPEPPASRARPPVDEARPAAPTYAGRFAAPSDEDEDEGAEDVADEAPAGPYDWGVKKKQQPKGAWLLDAEESREDEPAPEEPADAGGGGGGGARGYLMRKLGQEVQDLMPAIEALQRKNVVSDKEAAELRGEDPDDDLGDDAELSVETFRDHRARDESGDGMTPMKLVEQLRNVKRLQELLISKGLIGEDDLQRAPEE